MMIELTEIMIPALLSASPFKSIWFLDVSLNRVSMPLEGLSFSFVFSGIELTKGASAEDANAISFSFLASLRSCFSFSIW